MTYLRVLARSRGSVMVAVVTPEITPENRLTTSSFRQFILFSFSFIFSNIIQNIQENITSLYIVIIYADVILFPNSKFFFFVYPVWELYRTLQYSRGNVNVVVKNLLNPLDTIGSVILLSKYVFVNSFLDFS
jgi:hypothetical protein